MRTVSLKYFENMAAAKQSFCNICTKYHLEERDCESCKVNFLLKSTLDRILRETPPEVLEEQRTPIHCTGKMDLPSQLVKTIGQGPYSEKYGEEGARTSKTFVIYDENHTEAIRVRLVEHPSGFPDELDEHGQIFSRSKSYALEIYRNGVCMCTDIISDLSMLERHLRSNIKVFLKTERDDLWGMEPLPVVEQKLIIERTPEELANMLLRAKDVHADDKVTPMFALAAERGKAFNKAYVALAFTGGDSSQNLYLKVCNSIGPKFIRTSPICGTDASAVAMAIRALLVEVALNLDTFHH